MKRSNYVAVKAWEGCRGGVMVAEMSALFNNDSVGGEETISTRTLGALSDS